MTKVRLEDLRETGSLPNVAGKLDTTTPPRPVFTTQDLFGALTEIGIAHNGLMYRLRITRHGKLVLNK